MTVECDILFHARLLSVCVLPPLYQGGGVALSYIHPDPLPGEREQPPGGVCLAHTGLAKLVAGLAQSRRTILPLPGYVFTVRAEERGIYPAGMPAPQTRVGKSRCPLSSTNLPADAKSALLSPFQAGR